MRASGLPFVPLFAFLAGCQCAPFGVDTTRFVCTAQADCLEGFECRDVGAGLECVRTGTDADAGRDAGGGDAGEVDAGEADAGEVDAGEVDAGEADAGEADAGELDAGFDAGVIDAGPGALRFVNAPLTVGTGACSAQLTLETVGSDGGAVPVSAATAVSLGAAPGGVTFYVTSNCPGGQARTSVTIGAGNSSATFYASGSPAGTYSLTASAAPLTPASQNLVVVNTPTSLVFTTTPPNPVRAGTCLAASVEGRRTGLATPVLNATTIGLTVAPTGGARFYSDANCSTTITNTSMAAGTAVASFFVKPLTGGANAITAAAPFGSANQTITTTPVVRRGQCDFVARAGLPDGGTTRDLNNDCTISPPLTDLSASVLFTQGIAALTGIELGAAQVRCRLTSLSNMNCIRREDLDPASVHFQVAEVPTGLLVQRASSFGCAGTITLTTPVTQTRSFVLKTSANSTQTFDDEDAVVATLTSPTTVSLFPTSCQGYDVQVVDWNGITVARGVTDGGIVAGVDSLSVSGLAAAGLNRAVLLQPGIGSTSTRPVCSTMVRGALPSGSSIALTRSAADAGCPNNALESLAWERIDFGNKAVVREYTRTLAPGVPSVAVTITPVDTTRTLVFASSQIAGGQGAGETDHDGFSRFTESAFQLVLTNSTTVTATRAETTSAAVITFYVAELVP
ncbi:MAG: hypothetical protein Q8L48_24665 [Archangium sp.]|nr:hypothetical protein [Archangium sp.]